MYSEDNLLPISALQHLAFCPRQWGLMYLEGIWAENLLTAEGSQLHEIADEAARRLEDGKIIVNGLRLRSLKFGLVGRADIVEFHCDNTDYLMNRDGRELLLSDLVCDNFNLTPYPVEYKHGKPKVDLCDEIQLCAQALCLEEMLEIEVPEGAIFYGKPRRRTEVVFEDSLRNETIATARKLHELTSLGKTPLAKYEKKCRSCSIMQYCMPKSAGRGKSARRYMHDQLNSGEED